MDKSYSFISDLEPSIEQLEGLMRNVLQEVKERAKKANEKFSALQEQQIQKALQEWQLKQNKNDSQ